MFTRTHQRIATAYVILVLSVMGGLAIYLAQALPGEPLEARWRQLWFAIAVAAAAAIVLAIVVAIFVARATTEPLARLTIAARHLPEDEGAERFAVASRDEVGQLAAAIGQMAATLTQKLETAEAQRAEVAAILAGMADGVVIVDERRRVVAINRAAEELLGTSGEEATGSTLTQLLRRHEVVAIVEAGESSAAPLVVEIGPQQRQVQVVLTSVQVGGGKRQVILLQDVTELRRAETIRRDFVANVSHELRTPLAALRALVETLEDGALRDPEAGPEFLDRMHVEVDRLNQMVEELLELARIESGRVKLNFQRADVAEIVREATERMRPQAERQGQILSVELPDGPVEAVVDPDRLHQVVVNLVHNAVKFTPPRGSIRVAASKRGQQVAIEVADTGIGVRAENLPRLFERFYKTDRSRASPGTGLGLAIVKHIVQAHSGQVTVQSDGEGKGTTFTVVLPAVPAARLRARADAHARITPSSPSVNVARGELLETS